MLETGGPPSVGHSNIDVRVGIFIGTNYNSIRVTIVMYTTIQINGKFYKEN